MFKAFDLGHAFTPPHPSLPALLRLVPQSPGDIAFALLSLFLLIFLFRLLILIFLPSASPSPRQGQAEATTTPTKQPSQSRTPTDTIQTRTHTFLTSPLRAFAALWNMIIAPIVARPIPLPEPPTTLIDRPLDAAPPKLQKPESPWPVKQPYDAFLVLDVEATCQEGTDFNWPNEIIEWPVVLLRWRNKDAQGRAKELYIADEFRSFVRPTWRPELTTFCTSLTGITQAQVDRAPRFIKVLESFAEFLARNGLIDRDTGERLERFTWCSDGPFDIRDFVVKQCFISKVQMPDWLRGDVLDVRKVLLYFLNQESSFYGPVPGVKHSKPGMPPPRRRTLNIPQQLRALGLAEFVGRQHSGIDDTRNIARVLTELARRGIRLEPNTVIFPGRRWQWMGKPGQVLDEYCIFT